jgi:hypothetical protein
MLIGIQVALVGDWLAETKCHANPTVAHFLKGRPYAIYYFTISSEVFRALIICSPFREDDRLSQLHKLLASLIIAQHINEEFFFDITFQNAALPVPCLPIFGPPWITIPKVKTSAKPVISR